MNDRRFPTGSIGSIDDYHDPTLCLAISSKPITHVLQWHEPNNHPVKTTYYHLSIEVSACVTSTADMTCGGSTLQEPGRNPGRATNQPTHHLLSKNIMSLLFPKLE